MTEQELALKVRNKIWPLCTPYLKEKAPAVHAKLCHINKWLLEIYNEQYMDVPGHIPVLKIQNEVPPREPPECCG